MAKKKKLQVKAVARGFATTSVPKKVVKTDEGESGPQYSGPSVGESSQEDPSVDTKAQDQTSTGHPDDFDPDKVEEQSLQNLIDKFQDKTEKEIVRTVKAVEMDRLFSATLPRLEIDQVLVVHILALVDLNEVETKKVVNEPEDKAISKFAITYGTLRRLGFAEDRVEECLRSINGIDLNEAYDWLYLHCDDSELQEKHDNGESRTSRTASVGTPWTPRTPAHFQKSPSPPPPYSRCYSQLNANAPVFTPSESSFLRESVSEGDVLDRTTLNSKILASVFRSGGPTDSDLSSDADDLSSEYVRLKMRLSVLTSHRRPGDTTSASVVKEIQARLKAVTDSYFFDERDAEAMLRREREKADALTLQTSLNQAKEGDPEATPIAKVPKHRPPALLHAAQAEPARNVVDVFDDDEGSEIGGMFEILDEMPESMTNDSGVTYAIRDIALPKHWSGRTPKVLLQEAVAKADRYAAISYQDESGGSRAKRSSVRIRWDGQKMGIWTMDDIACYDSTQAEQYISLVALHSLTYPPTEGFSAGTTAATSHPTFFRLLPAVFRDVWDELETKRKEADDTINRAVWSKLRSILEPKLKLGEKVHGRMGKSTSEDDGRVPNTTRIDNGQSDAVRDSFLARQNSAAYQEMLIQRNALPIAQYRQEIIGTLEQSQVLVLSGETGCGKSTQLPSFILEHQLSRGQRCKIYCTEPRRISAISLAQRVSRELGEPAGAVGTLSSLVGYSIRLESNTTKNTRLAFVTNGIALRMLESGSGQGGHGTAFDEITHIIIDEVHERTIESDFLLIVLKSLLEQRSDLKIILMSATVDAEKISTFFGGCPTLHVPGRTFPVEVQYLEDAVEFTKWSISESSPYARRPHDKFYKGKQRTEWSEETVVNDGDDDEDEAIQENVKLGKRYSTSTADTINLLDERLIPYDLMIRVLERICLEDVAYATYSAAILIFMPGLGEIRRLNDLLTEHALFGSDDFRILPLHSTLSSENQSAVFDIPPPGIRKIVIATNIAETGITIPDVTCVLDSGKHREMRFDEKRQISRLVETYIAKSNAAQRRGRAGRVQNGLCFHLFTKLRHDRLMADSPLPEMMRLSLSDLSLRIKIMKVKLGTSIEDVLSRAMDPPSAINIQRAISALVEVRALTPSEEITPMGRLLSKLPTDVHLGKFLLTAALFRCLDPALTIAAVLNAKSPFITPFGMEQEADRAKNSFRIENSDFLTIHNAFSSWRRASANPGFLRKFCRANFLSHQNLQQIEELRQQFMGYLVDTSFISVDRSFIRDLSRSRYGRNRTRFVAIPPHLDGNSGNYALVNAALVNGLYPKVLTIEASSGQMRTISNNQPAAFHPSSINFGRKPRDFGVNHLAYFTLMHSKKLYAWETGPVDDLAMLLLCGEADFKLISNSTFIDRKIRFQIAPKSNVALKQLRTQLLSVLAAQFRSKPLTENQVLWNELALQVLGKIKFEDEEAGPSMIKY